MATRFETSDAEMLRRVIAACYLVNVMMDLYGADEVFVQNDVARARLSVRSILDGVAE